jgi:hypothetical protein
MKFACRTMKHTILLAVALTAGTAMAQHAGDKSLSFDRYSWVTTHNAFTSNGLLPNQSQTIEEQLTAGVRAFMLDLHHDDGRVRLCHGRCRGSSSVPFAEFANTTLLPFLETSPDSIVTLQLEDFTDRDQLLSELELAPGLVGKTFDPYSWSTDEWPAYDEIVRRGQRILIFSLNREQSGKRGFHGGELLEPRNHLALARLPVPQPLGRSAAAVAERDRQQARLAPALHDEPVPRDSRGIARAEGQCTPGPAGPLRELLPTRGGSQAELRRRRFP